MKGILPPLVTPLKSRDELDVAGLERLIEHVIAGGVHGIFILGSTGEAAGLSRRLRHELVGRVCRRVAGRVPVLVGVTDTAFAESAALGRAAAEAGARAAVVAPPFYFPAGQAELFGYLERLVPELGLPVLLYNMPAFTKIAYELETLRRAIDMPRVVGLKDSSGDLGYFREAVGIAAARKDWSVLMGPETLLAEALPLGAHGGVPGGSNLAPRLFVDLYDAYERGDRARVGELRERILRVSSTVYAVEPGISGYLRGLKCALSLLGICDDFVAEPFERFAPPERERVRRHLADLGFPALEG